MHADSNHFFWSVLAGFCLSLADLILYYSSIVLVHIDKFTPNHTSEIVGEKNVVSSGVRVLIVEQQLVIVDSLSPITYLLS